MFTKTAFLLGVLGSTVSATTYATFYSDSSCKNDPTDVNFSVDNPGCFSVGDRQYVKYHGTNVQCFSLVKSPSPSCPCQFDCVEGASSADSPVDTCGPIIVPDSACHYIGQSQSLRYIGGDCPADNCPSTNSRRELSASSSFNTTYDPSFVGYFDQAPAAPVNAEPSKRSNNLLKRVGRLRPRDYGPPGIGYFRLCQDQYCTKGCSIDFRTTNPGCFAGDSYQSMQISGGLSDYRFVASPSPSCPCQSACGKVDTGLDCTVLDSFVTNAVSLRMVNGETCDPNNC